MKSPIDAHAEGIRGPDGEVDAAITLVGDEVGPELLEVAEVGPLADQVEVEVGHDRPEPVGVDELPGVPLVVLDLQPIGDRRRRPGGDVFEEAVGMDSIHRPGRPRLAGREVDDPGFRRLGEERADHADGLAADVDGVMAEEGERVPEVGVDDPVDLGAVGGRGLWRRHVGFVPFDRRRARPSGGRRRPG